MYILGLRHKIEVGWLHRSLFWYSPHAVESVAWGSGRKDLLYAVFLSCFLFVLLKISAAQKGENSIYFVWFYFSSLLSKSDGWLLYRVRWCWQIILNKVKSTSKHALIDSLFVLANRILEWWLCMHSSTSCCCRHDALYFGFAAHCLCMLWIYWLSL